MGKRLLVENGWDPFLEDISSLWLLHWLLTSNTSRALIWHLAFSYFYEQEFSKKSLAIFVQKQLERLNISTTKGMIDREVDCFTRTYSGGTQPSKMSEESLACPLVDLDLIRSIPQDNVYRFNIGPKPTLATEIFGYCLLDFLDGLAQTRRTFTIDECVYQPGSPGQVFRLDENSVVEHVESLVEATEGKIRLQETAGIRQLYIDASDGDFFKQMANDLVESYYEQ